jgi:hypothetical protein
MTILDFMTKSGIKQYKKYDGEIGLEIETETKSQSSYPPDFLVAGTMPGQPRWIAPSLRYWDVHPDGSLRDFGLEYVLKQPIKFKKELPDALEEFKEKTAKVKFIKNSITTSVHVHLNMLNESFKTLGNFLTLYTLFESLLIRYSGPDRLSNLFCLPICDAEDTYKNIIQMMKYAENKQYKGMLFTEANVKYAALNLGAFSSYGSMEVRSFRGETDTKSIYNWVAILYSLLEYARQDVNPKQIMLSWKERERRLLDDVFKDYRKEISHPDELKLIDNNVWYAGSIAYGIKNWESLDETVKAPAFKPNQKDLEYNAMNHFGIGWGALDGAQQDHLLKVMREAHERKHLLSGLSKIPTIQPAAIRPARRPAGIRDEINPFFGVEEGRADVEVAFDELIDDARAGLMAQVRNPR